MAVVKEVKDSIGSFLLGCSVFLLHTALTCGHESQDVYQELTGSTWLITTVIACYTVLIVGLVWTLSSKAAFGVTIRGIILGVILSFSIILSRSSSMFQLVGWFVAALAFFHWSEFVTTGLTNPRNLSLSSYVLNHSFEYHAAIAASILEFLIESYFYPDWKQLCGVSFAGLAVVLGGEFVRKLAMWQASTNFNHYIRYRREDGHQLVTTGVYAWVRHPSYVGWFYWSIATQVMILNPVCAVLYTVCSWKFFHDRVIEEEKTLISFFGQQYVEYQRRVGTGLPFITGFTIASLRHVGDGDF